MKKDTILICLIAIMSTLLVLAYCSGGKKVIPETDLRERTIDSLKTQLRSFEARRDTVKLETARKQDEYKAKPAGERIKYLRLIDTVFIPLGDTAAILSLAGVDSVNKLSMAYAGVVDELALCDSAGAVKDAIISTDSVVKQELRSEAVAWKKRAESREKAVFRWKIAAIVVSGVAATLFLAK